MIRAANISTEIMRRKRRNYLRLWNACLAIAGIMLIVARANGGISASWLLVLSPILTVGSVVLLHDLAVVIAASWHLGCILVARSDDAARKSVTVRNKP